MSSPSKPTLAANDPNTKIPRVVKANADKADSIHKAAYNTPDPTPETPPVTPEVTPSSVTPDAPTKEVVPAAPAAPIVPPPPPEPQNWEHLYKTWKGRYDSELPRFKELTRSQQERIAQLETAVADLQQTGKNISQEDFTNFERLITEKEISDYGPELLEVIGKKAQEALAPTLSKLQRENEELKKQLRGTTREVASTARERMYQMLETQCPQWHQLNNDENFLAWLQLPDRYSGAIRAELLNVANERNDGPRVLAFFQGYLEEAATVGVPTPVTAVPVPQQRTPQVTPQLQLEALAAPGRAKTTATTPVPGEKPIITRADISAFYANKNAGRYTTELAQEYERIIWDAQRDGRIR